jgi:FixJ family two-component response regulator
MQVRQENTMMNKPLLVSVVDDDESVRESLPDLLRELGYAARTFSSSEEFLASDGMLDTKCLILDIAMPGIGGLDLKRELDRRELKCPVIFITARRDEGLRSRLLEDGAVDCLFKPFSDTALQRALDLALKGK